jgi:hydroxymethylpyrimidine pyrophosphatase-like HAD family hydrolase
MATVLGESAVIPVPPGVRLIGSDLDGTLLLPDGSVGARTRAALDDLRDSELDLVIVTGRPPRWISPVVEMTGHRGIGIGANGAVVLDLADGHVTDVFALKTDTALEVVDRLRRALPGVVFAVERARIDELVETGYVVKLLVRPPDDHGFDADTFLSAGAEAVAGLAEVTHSNPADRLLEIAAPGVSKATTLAFVAARDGIDHTGVITAGDAPNDLPMLEWAQTSYAVANAHPLVLDAATHILPASAEEGVGQLIEAALAAET